MIPVLLVALLQSQIEIRAGGKVVATSRSEIRPRVLFVGNSLVYWNEMPWMLEQMAKAAAVPLRADFSGGSGMTLRQHWERGKAARAMREGKYDIVVLQPQSTEVVRTPAETRRFAEMLMREAVKSGAKPILMETWHPREPKFGSAFRDLASALKIPLAPVGSAFRNLRGAGIEAIDEVGHPTLAGSYLEACMFYALVTGRSPQGLRHRFDVRFEIPEVYRRALETEKIDAVVAAAIQREAWNAVNSTAAKVARQ